MAKRYDITGVSSSLELGRGGATLTVDEFGQLVINGTTPYTTLPADAAGVLTNDGSGNLTWGAGGGGSFDPTASQTITGEWKFDISGGKSFFATDDVTLASPTKFVGFLDHSTLNPSDISYFNFITNSTGSNTANLTAVCNDDGSAFHYISYLNNTNGVSIDTASLNTDGTSNRYIAAGEITIKVSPNKSFQVIDDQTTPTKYFGIFDGVDLPATAIGSIYGHNTYISGDDVVGNYWLYDKSDSSSSQASIVKNVNGQCSETSQVTAAGVSTKNITADNIVLAATTATLNGGDILTSNEVTSGTFTPTFTIVSGPLINPTNLASFYQRVGDVVSYTVRFSVTASGTVTSFSFRHSLPIASNFTAVTDGSAAVSVITSVGGPPGAGTGESVIATDDILCSASFSTGVTSGGIGLITVTGSYSVI